MQLKCVMSVEEWYHFATYLAACIRYCWLWHPYRWSFGRAYRGMDDVQHFKISNRLKPDLFSKFCREA